MFGTAISAAAATESEESRRTPRDRRAYLHHSRGRQLIFLTGTPLTQKVRESGLISIAILRITRPVATETNRA